MRALRLFILIGSVLALMAWVMSQDGTFELNFGPYHIAGETSFLAVVLLFSALTILLIHRLYLGIVAIPKTWARHRRETHLRQGHKALAHALSALASGDHTLAYTHASRAQKLLPEFPSVPNALLATAAHHTGQPLIAQRALQNLLTSEARDLGVRGLIQAAISDDNWSGAMNIARNALAETPRTAAVARLVYDLECQCGEFQSALKRQSFLVRRRVLSTDMARHDAVMLYTALSRDALKSGDHKTAYTYARHAYRLDPSFIPAACDLIDLHRGFGHTWRAMRVLKHSFTINPHPDLIDRHEQMSPQTKNLARRLRYHEKFLSLRPDYAPAQMLLAHIAISEKLWGEARAYLAVAEKLAPTKSFYQFRATFNEQQGDQKQVQYDLEQAMIAAPDPTWHCRITGKTFDHWEPLVMPDHIFGSIIWGVPGQSLSANNNLALPLHEARGVNSI